MELHHQQQHIGSHEDHRNVDANNSVHWNYSAPLTNMPLPLGQSTPVITNNNTQNNWPISTPPKITRASKRALSESDYDDLYSEESSKDQ